MGIKNAFRNTFEMGFLKGDGIIRLEWDGNGNENNQNGNWNDQIENDEISMGIIRMKMGKIRMIRMEWKSKWKWKR